MKVTVLGAGAWGTALARILHENQHQVTLWAHDPARLERIRQTRRNEPNLPGIELPESWLFEPDLNRAIGDSPCVVVAVPSKAFRAITRELARFAGVAISVTKGIEYDTGLTMCGVLGQTMPRARAVALSGPTLALEVARNMPSACVAAGTDEAAAALAQQLFHRPTFRVYRSTDPLGVELGGALKNVVAIAAGAVDGLGFGDNSKAALITRGQAEIRRLGVRLGARTETFSGLSGLGDLTVTCFSRLSRNRTLGEALGRGESPESALSRMSSIAEGVPTARSAHRLGHDLGVSIPIIDEVHAVLHEQKSTARAMHDLLNRDSKAED